MSMGFHGSALCALLLLSACSRNEQVNIEFRLDPGAFARACDPVSEAGAVHTVKDFRFFVSDPVLVDVNGGRHPVMLEVQPPWQSSAAALIDLGAGRDCDSGGQSRSRLSGKAASAEYAGLEFTVGVPFEQNHVNPLTQQAPLNIGSLFWTWQLGYKFMRVDLGLPAGADTGWSFHLGSTGCKSASSVRPPAAACGQPNRVRVVLSAFDPLTDAVEIDLDALLDGIDPDVHSSCMGSFYETLHCSAVLARLGLDAVNGECPDGCSGQSVFRRAQQRRPGAGL